MPEMFLDILVLISIRRRIVFLPMMPWALRKTAIDKAKKDTFKKKRIKLKRRMIS